MPLLLGDVAQLGEHLLCKQGVAGSSPAISTATSSGRRGTKTALRFVTYFGVRRSIRTLK